MWAILFVTSVLAEAQNLCEERCGRIYQRSLARVGFDDVKLRNLLERQRPLGTVKDVCWRVYDHLDCMEHCGDSPEHEKFAKFVRAKCRFSLRGIENALSCVSRYHSFMEVRCSTFLKEAERLKSLADPSYTPSQEICRYLHLNTLCLENTVSMYCANAKKIFRRLNFRDYFPNFILPLNDTLFDDLDLDSCQMFDFVKKNIKMTEKQIDEELTTVVNDFEKEVEAKRKPMTTVSTSTDRTEFTTLLKELLEESEDDPHSSTSAPFFKSTEKIKTTWFSPTLKSSSTSLIFPPNKTSRKSLILIPNSSPTAMNKSYTIRTNTTQLPITTAITTTTSATSTTASSRTTTETALRNTKNVTDEKDDTEEDYEEEREEEYGDEKHENVSVEVVPIQTLETSRKTVTEGPPRLSTRRRLFSEDSWEQPPPNFGYSSLRYANGGVTPLNIDTSTLFGMDEETKDEEDEEENSKGKKSTAPGRKKEIPRKIDMAKMHEEDAENVEQRLRQKIQLSVVNTSRPISETLKENSDSIAHTLEPVTSVTPLLSGEVVVKKIHEWDDATHSREYGHHETMDHMDEEQHSNDDTISMEVIEHTESSVEIGNTTVLPRSNIDWPDRETLIIIYSLLFAITIFSLMCLLICYIWCRKRRQSHDFKTTF